jgi:hypothetical protein
MDAFGLLWLSVAVLLAVIVALLVVIYSLSRELDGKDVRLADLHQSNADLRESLATLTRDDNYRQLHMGV